MKVIILNGPKSCGKDHAARVISQYYGEENCPHMKFSQPIKDIVSRIVGISPEELETNKETPNLYRDMSGRDMQIFTFQQLAKIYGNDWLGITAVNDLQQIDPQFCVFSDGGRPDDITPLLKLVGASNVMIVQIMREGCHFGGDIRSYISAPNAVMKHIVNKSDTTYENEIIDFAGQFFGEGEE